MICIICSENAYTNKRMVCFTCLKPVCDRCFLSMEDKKCPNCRSEVYYPMVLRNYRAIIDLMNRNMDPICMLSNNSNCCSQDTFDLTSNGFGGHVFSCNNHSFTCINCCNKYSRSAAKLCGDCLQVHCNKCVVRIGDKNKCAKCQNIGEFGVFAVTVDTNQP